MVDGYRKKVYDKYSAILNIFIRNAENFEKKEICRGNKKCF